MVSLQWLEIVIGDIFSWLTDSGSDLEDVQNNDLNEAMHHETGNAGNDEGILDIFRVDQLNLRFETPSFVRDMEKKLQSHVDLLFVCNGAALDIKDDVSFSSESCTMALASDGDIFELAQLQSHATDSSASLSVVFRSAQQLEKTCTQGGFCFQGLDSLRGQISTVNVSAASLKLQVQSIVRNGNHFVLFHLIYVIRRNCFSPLIIPCRTQLMLY